MLRLWSPGSVAMGSVTHGRVVEVQPAQSSEPSSAEMSVTDVPLSASVFSAFMAERALTSLIGVFLRCRTEGGSVQQAGEVLHPVSSAGAA